MAYVPETDDPTKQNNQDPNAPTILSSPSASIGDQAPSSTPNTGAAPTEGADAKTSSGSFTNLQDYISANKGNDAALGGAIQNNAAAKASTADAAGNSWKDAAAKTISDNTVTDTNGVTDKLNTIGKGGAAAPDIDANDFTTVTNADYKGPKDAQSTDGYGDAKATYKPVEDYGQQANATDKGALLSDVYGVNGRQYNAGERNLDSFIVGSGDQGSAALKNVADTYGNYGNHFQGLSDLINQQASSAAATTKDTHDKAVAAAQAAVSGVQGRFTGAQAQAEKANADAQAQYQKATSGDVDTLQGLGLSGDQLLSAQLHPELLANSVVQGGGYKAGDFADANDVGNYSKLMQLIGANPNLGITPSFTDAQLAKGGQGNRINTDTINANIAAYDKAHLGNRFSGPALVNGSWADPAPAPVAAAPATPSSGPQGLIQNMIVNAASGLRNPKGAVDNVGNTISDTTKGWSPTGW